MAEGRRGFLGKLLGGLAAGAAVVAKPDLLKAKERVVEPPVPPPVPKPLAPPVVRTTRGIKPGVDGEILVTSAIKNHRIQITSTRAIQFRGGKAWVSAPDAARLETRFGSLDKIGVEYKEEQETRAPHRPFSAGIHHDGKININHGRKKS